MKILSFVDLHLSKKHYLQLKKKAEKVDLILCAGDVTIFGNSQKFILNKLNQLKKPMLLIHGNHETARDLKKGCRTLKNLTFIHKKFYKQDNLGIIGYGGGGFSMTDERFEKFGKKMMKKMKKFRKKKENAIIILLTHGPPYKTKLDKITDSYCGNKSLKSFIRESKPDYAISGHIHENFHKSDTIGKTIVQNPGPSGKIITVS